MNRRAPATVDSTQTGTGIQHRGRSFLTSDRAAAWPQPRTSARGMVSVRPLQGLSEAGHRDR
jgi:hypothetical protein